MMAMLSIWRSPVLREMGWKLLLQIHDEVILEGPTESKDEVTKYQLYSFYLLNIVQAMKEVVRCMQNPFDCVGLHPMKGKC